MVPVPRQIGMLPSTLLLQPARNNAGSSFWPWSSFQKYLPNILLQKTPMVWTYLKLSMFKIYDNTAVKSPTGYHTPSLSFAHQQNATKYHQQHRIDEEEYPLISISFTRCFGFIPKKTPRNISFFLHIRSSLHHHVRKTCPPTFSVSTHLNATVSQQLLCLLVQPYM